MHTTRRIVVCLAAAAAAGVSSACETAPYLRQRGLEAFETRKYEQAEQRFAKAASIEPGNWSCHYYLGRIYLKQHRPLEAQLALELALSVRSEDAETSRIYDALAESFYQQRDSSALYGLLKQACDEFGTSDDFLRQARYLAMMGDADNAKVAFRKAAHFAPSDDPTPYLATAEFFESVGDTDNAVLALRRALAIEPESKRIQKRLRQYGVVPGPTLPQPPAE